MSKRGSGSSTRSSGSFSGVVVLLKSQQKTVEDFLTEADRADLSLALMMQ
nr:MAG TPA: hypothetical protein [Caudoviricetes sp.]